jgi:hypothetical protein
MQSRPIEYRRGLSDVPTLIVLLTLLGFSARLSDSPSIVGRLIAAAALGAIPLLFVVGFVATLASRTVVDSEGVSVRRLFAPTHVLSWSDVTSASYERRLLPRVCFHLTDGRRVTVASSVLMWNPHVADRVLQELLRVGLSNDALEPAEAAYVGDALSVAATQLMFAPVLFVLTSVLLPVHIRPATLVALATMSGIGITVWLARRSQSQRLHVPSLAGRRGAMVRTTTFVSLLGLLLLTTRPF